MSPSIDRFFALVGPPNAGKTALFNTLTGTGGKPVNYPGATVDYAVGVTRRVWGAPMKIVDTPGTYSLFPKSPEETVTREILFGTNGPAVVVVVVDGTQLSRHLVLARQVIESGHQVVLAVTMKDIVEKDGFTLDTADLSTRLGVPVVSLNALTGEGVRQLTSALAARVASAQGNTTPPAPWSAARQQQELKWARELHEMARVPTASPQRPPSSSAHRSARLDSWLLHPFWGSVFFLLAMGGLFTSIFWVAAPAMDAISDFFEWGAQWVLERYPNQLLADFLAGGIWLSFGAILTFVPQIAILFFGITLLEDSGYLARAATLIDKPLTRLGLNGRSFVPLLSGYACAIPAMMAARTIPNRKERWITLFVIPLMSCSARLPVYALLLAFLFWGEPAWKPGLALTAIYLLSVVVGAVAAAIVQKVIRVSEHSFFMLELPLYRRPSLRSVLSAMFQRTQSYLVKAGPAIFVFAVGIWVATTFPNHRAPTPSEKLNSSYAAYVGQAIDPVMEPMGGDWRTGVALITAFAAREVFVSALGLVLQVSDSSETNGQVSLLDTMRAATKQDGSLLFTPASAVGLIVFFMIALQCMSTVAVARREFGGWRYPLIQLVVFNLVAYALAVAAVQGMRAAGIP